MLEFKKMLKNISFNRDVFDLRYSTLGMSAGKKVAYIIFKVLFACIFGLPYMMLSLVSFSYYLTSFFYKIPSKLIKSVRSDNTPYEADNKPLYNATYVILYIFIVPFDVLYILTMFFNSVVCFTMDCLAWIICLGRNNPNALKLCFASEVEEDNGKLYHLLVIACAISIYAIFVILFNEFSYYYESSAFICMIPTMLIVIAFYNYNNGLNKRGEIRENKWMNNFIVTGLIFLALMFYFGLFAIEAKSDAESYNYNYGYYYKTHPDYYGDVSITNQYGNFYYNYSNETFTTTVNKYGETYNLSCRKFSSTVYAYDLYLNNVGEYSFYISEDGYVNISSYYENGVDLYSDVRQFIRCINFEARNQYNYSPDYTEFYICLGLTGLSFLGYVGFKLPGMLVYLSQRKKENQ